jgi:NADH-quinone oxidoreductase subunit C
VSETADTAAAHPVLALVRERLGDAVVDGAAYRGDAAVSVERERIVAVLTILRDDPALAFDLLSDVTAVDYLGSVPRFEVVYHLYSTRLNHRIRVKARVPEDDPTIATVTTLWKGADWLERETWDMYGIRFQGHADLRRIYLYEEFQGHPLRKDYPKEKRQPLIQRDDVDVSQVRREEAREGLRYGKWS